MIISYKNGEWKEPGSLCQAIGIFKEGFAHHRTISVVGGGGKTTVIRKIMNECRNEGIPCAVSTTTHIQKYDTEYFLGVSSVEMFRRIMLKYGVVWMGKETTDKKLTAFPDTYIKEISNEPGMLLLEADGAKRLPVKAPAEHEPVICAQTDIVLNVYGMSAVGKKLKDGCFRVKEMEQILGKTEEDILYPEDIVTLAVSQRAGRKCVADDMEYQVILNQVDTEEQKEMAVKIAEAIVKKLSGEQGKKLPGEQGKKRLGRQTEDMACMERISRVHVVSDLIQLEERW